MVSSTIKGLRICPNLNFMFQEESSLLNRYVAAHKLGFVAVETGNPYVNTVDELQKVKEDCALEQVLINTPVGDASKGEIGFASLPGKEHQFLHGLKTAVQYATSLKCKLIHIMAGLVMDQRLVDDHNKTYLSNLKKAAPILEAAGIVGIIEPINPYSVPGYYLSDYDQAISVIKDVNSTHIGLLLDVFHLQQIRGDVTHSLNKYFPYVKHVQVAQVPDRHEPDTEGELNFDYIFALLGKMNYTGWIGLEYKPASTTEQGLKWIEQLENAK